MKSLQEFYSQTQTNIFVETQTDLPQFFLSNLVDPARVVKGFYNDVQANIRVFYFQYLKLCFEIQSPNYMTFIQKVEEVINNPTFNIVFYNDDDPSTFNDTQFKTLISEFFGLLGQASEPVESALGHYSIMDTVFIYFFRSLLILTGRAESLDSYVPRQDLIDFLCQYFGVDISVHDRCIKFVDTDIFVFEEDPKEVFMAYMDYEKLQSSNKNSQLEQSLEPQPAINPPPSYQEAQPTQFLEPANNRAVVKQSYIASQFMDYTDVKKETKNLTDMLKEKEDNLKKNAQSKAGQNFAQIIQSQTKNTLRIASNQSQNRHSNQSQNRYKQNETIKNYMPHVQTEKRQEWQPTKDPGFNINEKIIQKPSSSYGNFQANNYEYKPSSNHSYSLESTVQNQTLFANKPSSTLQANYLPPTTTSAYNSSQSLNTMKNDSSSKLIANQMISPIYEPEYKPPSNYKPPSSSGYKKNPYGLNISEEFTDSRVMKAMCEPHKSNVESIRSRARIFRNSLKNTVAMF